MIQQKRDRDADGGTNHYNIIKNHHSNTTSNLFLCYRPCSTTLVNGSKIFRGAMVQLQAQDYTYQHNTG